MANNVNEIKVFVSGALIFLNINADIANILLLLMGFDLAFGIVKAFYISEMEFDFKELFKGITVKLLILTVPMIFALVAKGVGIGNFTFVVDTVFKLFILAEGFSIYNSFLSIKKNKVIKQTDLISVIVERMQGYFKNKIDAILNAFDK